MEKIRKVNKPCPFCGTTELLVINTPNVGVVALYCQGCPCGLEDNSKTLKELITIWEGRVE